MGDLTRCSHSFLPDIEFDPLSAIRSAGAREYSRLLRRSEVLCSTARATAATKNKEKMRPGSVFGLTTLGLVSRTSMDDRLGDGPPLWEGEQQFHAFLGYALLTAMAKWCCATCGCTGSSSMRHTCSTRAAAAWARAAAAPSETR